MYLHTLSNSEWNYNLKVNRFITTQSAVSVSVFLNPTYNYGRPALTLDTHSLTVETCILCNTADLNTIFDNTYEISKFWLNRAHADPKIPVRKLWRALLSILYFYVYWRHKHTGIYHFGPLDNITRGYLNKTAISFTKMTSHPLTVHRLEPAVLPTSPKRCRFL
jgi:hypothetical protein